MDDTDRHKHTEEHPAVLTGTEAAQASGRKANFRVLVVGLAMVVIAFLVIGAAFYLPQ